LALLAVNGSVAADRTDAQVEIIYSVDVICNALRSDSIGVQDKGVQAARQLSDVLHQRRSRYRWTAHGHRT
jgi:hypothetical protein